VRLKGLRNHLEQARTSGRLSDADLVYAFYELSRELSRIRDTEDETAGRDVIARACDDLNSRRSILAAQAPAKVVDQLKILSRKDGVS
jgi:hypothetical protein